MELVLRSTSHKVTVELAIKSDENGVWFALLSDGDQIDFNLEKEDWDTFKAFIQDGLNKQTK